MKLGRSLIMIASSALVSLLISLLGYSRLPELVAIHWDINGVPDGFAPKLVAAFSLPSFIAILPFLYRIAQHFNPRKDNLRRSAEAVTAAITVTAIVLAVVHVSIVATALGYEVNIPRTAIGCVAILLIVTGNYMGKTRSNFVIGIRNKWTLGSERVWHRTHRLSGWLFVANGLCALMVALFGKGSAAEGLWLLTIIAITLILVQAYSYIAWRNDNAQHVR